jgi:hypothetical protein
MPELRVTMIFSLDEQFRWVAQLPADSGLSSVRGIGATVGEAAESLLHSFVIHGIALVREQDKATKSGPASSGGKE